MAGRVLAHVERRFTIVSTLLVAAIVLTSAPRAQQAQNEDQKKSAETVQLAPTFQELDAAAADAAAATTVYEVGVAGPAATIHTGTAMTIPGSGTSGAASPYPVNLVVSGFVGTIGRVAVRLNNLSHTAPTDLDILLVDPSGTAVILMSDVGGRTDIDGVHLTFQEGAPAVPLNGPIVSGTFAPTDLVGDHVFPFPAPPGPYSTALAAFEGFNPNGTWSLYVVDDGNGDVGSSFGFTLLISPQFDNHTAVPVPRLGTLGSTESSVIVSGITAPITKVTVSFYITHTRDSDLDIFLIGPDNTEVELTTGNGGSGENYGTACAPVGRTIFDDDSATPITFGIPPFRGTFRPEGQLAAFNGKSGSAANGTWRLRITDVQFLESGTLHCWSVAVSQENTTVQPPTGLTATSVVGNQVTLRWAAPAGGVAPTNYVLEGGVSPGQTLASIPTNNTAPILTFAAPTGSFFVRIRAQAGGALSAPSNEIPLFVNVPVTPSAPAVFQGVADGTTVSLAWRNTFGGGAPTSLILDVSGTFNGSIPLGVSDSIALSGVPPGRYLLGLRAANAGGTSGPALASGGIGGVIGSVLPIGSPTDCGHFGPPGPPTRFLAYGIGNTIFVVWEPAASGWAPTAYALTVAGSFIGSVTTTSRAVSGTVGPGRYELSVAALSPCGQSAFTPAQTVTIP